MLSLTNQLCISLNRSLIDVVLNFLVTSLKISPTIRLLHCSLHDPVPSSLCKGNKDYYHATLFSWHLTLKSLTLLHLQNLNFQLPYVATFQLRNKEGYGKDEKLSVRKGELGLVCLLNKESAGQTRLA